MSEVRPLRKKVVVVGDGACGKTCLLISFMNGIMPDGYVPTVFETYVTDIIVENNTRVELSLWDTAGQDAYDRLRPLSYPDTDVMVVCFSVDQPDSLYNAFDKWVPEARHFCPSVPLVIVCTKVDLRFDEDVIYRLGRVRQAPVSAQEGIELAERVKAMAYVECSSVTQQGVSEVFEAAVRATLRQPDKATNKKLKKMKKIRCTFL